LIETLRGHGFGLAGAGRALFGWRLAIALFQRRDDHRRYEFLFAVVVKLDDDSFF
jgi:hypothetical protein